VPTVTVVVVVLAVFSAVCMVALLVLRRRCRDQVQTATSDADRLRVERDEALDRVRTRDGEVAEVRDALATTREALEVTSARAEEQAALLGVERRSGAEQLARLEAVVAAAHQDRDRLEADVAAARQDRDRLEVDLAAARLDQDRAAAEPSPETPAPASVGLDLSPSAAAVLWALELARSERTWRHSVAPLPLSESPFPEADDPLRLAVEVEAAALREEVGAPLEVRWSAEVTDPTRSLVVLRLAQELLAGAARAGEAAVLDVGGTDPEVVLHLAPADDEAAPVTVEPPAVPGGVVSATTADDGLRLVVRMV
jgi:hypothetical protein